MHRGRRVPKIAMGDKSHSLRPSGRVDQEPVLAELREGALARLAALLAPQRGLREDLRCLKKSGVEFNPEYLW